MRVKKPIRAIAESTSDRHILLCNVPGAASQAQRNKGLITLRQGDASLILLCSYS